MRLLSFRHVGVAGVAFLVFPILLVTGQSTRTKRVEDSDSINTRAYYTDRVLRAEIRDFIDELALRAVAAQERQNRGYERADELDVRGLIDMLYDESSSRDIETQSPGERTEKIRERLRYLPGVQRTKGFFRKLKVKFTSEGKQKPPPNTQISPAPNQNHAPAPGVPGNPILQGYGANPPPGHSQTQNSLNAGRLPYGGTPSAQFYQPHLANPNMVPASGFSPYPASPPPPISGANTHQPASDSSNYNSHRPAGFNPLLFQGYQGPLQGNGQHASHGYALQSQKPNEKDSNEPYAQKPNKT